MRPVNEAELAEMVRAARGPLLIKGGGTRKIGRVHPGIVLETSGLSGINLYEPGALTMVVQAGTPLDKIEATLANERQRLAFEVPDMRRLLQRSGSSTIGGVVAANASGPRRVQVGACRDALLGVRFVDGTGAIVKNGGRVMKNVTGYDLVKLLAGSQGTLGVLTEVSLKVQAIPEAEVTLVAERDVGAGLATLRAALASPFDVAGVAYLAGTAMVRIEGMAGSVAYRARQLETVLGGAWDSVDAATSQILWRGVRDVDAFAQRSGSVWRIAVTPTMAAQVATKLGGEAIFDWGGGLLWLLQPSGDAASVRAAVAGIGHATLVRGLDTMDDVAVFPPEPSAVAALSAGLRAKFDPRGILNSGIMA